MNRDRVDHKPGTLITRPRWRKQNKRNDETAHLGVLVRILPESLVLYRNEKKFYLKFKVKTKLKESSVRIRLRFLNFYPKKVVFFKQNLHLKL